MSFRFFSLLVLSTLIIACNEQTPEEKSISNEPSKISKDPTAPTENKLNLSPINLVIDTETPIDSVWVADIGQKERFFLPYQDTIKVDFKRKLNDLYTIRVHAEGKKIEKQLWLDGGRLLIDLTLKRQLSIDNVYHSSLYNNAVQYETKYKELLTTKADSTTIDKFLISEIRKYIDTPLAHAIVANYVSRNQNNRDKIDNVYRIMRMQTDSLKDHFINNQDKIKQILDHEAVQFNQYALGDLTDQKTTITLDPSKQYLVDFWFVQCAPCIRDHKRIAKNYTIFEKNNIELIGVSRDDKYKVWKRYLSKHNYPWVNVREQKPEKRLTYDLSVWEYPTYALIDHKGSIQARFRSFAQFENYINKNNNLRSR